MIKISFNYDLAIKNCNSFDDIIDLQFNKLTINIINGIEVITHKFYNEKAVFILKAILKNDIDFKNKMLNTSDFNMNYSYNQFKTIIDYSYLITIDDIKKAIKGL